MTFRTLSIRLASVAATSLVVVAVAGGGIVDVNPDISTNSDPNGSSGGRINAGLARVMGQPNTFYAASEYGGLFKTTDGAVNWTHLNGHIPTFTWDVEVDPANASRVYATSWYDGRVSSLAGIEVSGDAGATWSKPASTTPSGPYNCSATRKAEPSAFGIGVAPDASQNVVVGTNCGVAVSHDSGATWTFVDPTAATTASNVWDVWFQAGGIVDACGDDGHLHSTDSGDTWTNPAGSIPTGRCSVTASPDESYVLFVVASDNFLYESDDAGGSWTSLGQRGAQGRVPFVATNQRSDSGSNNIFDAWYADTQLFSAQCTTPSPAASGGSARCPAVSTWTNRQTGAHWDAGDIAFDSGSSVDACPRLYTTDGGAHRNTDLGGGCQNPQWLRSNVGLHALFLWSMAGADRPGAGEFLYFGAQDNGTFSTQTADSSPPTWANPNCCDTFDITATPTWVLGTTCCFSSGRFNRLQLAGANYASPAEINTYPAGNIGGFTWGKRVNTWGGNNAVVITSSGIFTTADITVNPIVWTQLPALPGGSPCNVRVAVSSGTPTFFVQTGQCTGRGVGSDGTTTDRLYWHSGTGGTGAWARIDDTDGISGGIGVFAVDPNNPDRVFASNTNQAAPHMIRSTDRGVNWEIDPGLDTLMTGNGTFKFFNSIGPVTFNGGAGASFSGYFQPTFIDVSQNDGGVVVAGATDAGIFLSLDGGASWGLVTDPNGVTKPHIPRPREAYFDNESPAGTITVYVGTQGRGVWRLVLEAPVADAGGPYSTPEGQNAQLDGTASTGTSLSYAWDLDNDGAFDDSTLDKPMFTAVGQDGVFTVRLQVTNGDGVVAIDTATVTVTNVPPTVESLASDGPKPENTAVTVTGLVRDPGWLEVLTATINCGDGAGAQPLTGTLENVRPDATLTFSVAHIYGDDGVFTVTVCGKDDDALPQCSAIPVTITNVAPTAEITAPASTTTINGVDVVITNQGATVGFAGRSTDPGSDDLALSWNWDDGPPVPDVTTMYLNDPSISSDPDPSPSINPRDVTDAKSHAFSACLFDVDFSAADDDSGVASDTIKVLVTGNSTVRFSAGYWQNVFRSRKSTPFTDAQITCYLKIVGFVSLVFNETTDASTIAKAYDVLKVGSSTSAKEQFDRQLLATLINFANGEPDWNELIDTNGDGVGDTPFLNVIAAAEAVRNNPASTNAQIVAQKDLLEKINLGTA